MSKIIKTTPFLSHKLWGGDYLARAKALPLKTEPLGETWEISTLLGQSSTIGELELSNFCSLSYLVKFIDTKAHLSVQVHPHDAYASEVENSSGKTECWFILKSDVGAGIYLGFKEGVTRKEFFTAVELGLNVDKFLNFIPVKAGDYFFVPAGAIHAIGAGVILCEVQQSSGVTYRVWDWNRLGTDGKSRELHIEKAKDVVNFDREFNSRLKNLAQQNLFNGALIKEIVKHQDFNVELYVFDVKKKIELNLKEKSSLVLLEGSMKCNDTLLSELESAFVVEAGMFNFEIESEKVCFLIVN